MYTTAIEWVNHIPLNRGLIAAIQHSQAVLQPPQTVVDLSSCRYPACNTLAVQHCSECHADYCTEHDGAIHALLSSHARIPMHGKAAAIQELMTQRSIAPAAAARRAQLNKQLAETNAHCTSLLHAKTANDQDLIHIKTALAQAELANARIQEQYAKCLALQTQHTADCARATAQSDLDLLGTHHASSLATVTSSIASLSLVLDSASAPVSTGPVPVPVDTSPSSLSPSRSSFASVASASASASAPALAPMNVSLYSLSLSPWLSGASATTSTAPVVERMHSPRRKSTKKKSAWWHASDHTARTNHSRYTRKGSIKHKRGSTKNKRTSSMQ
jgi:hypothetical protein